MDAVGSLIGCGTMRWIEDVVVGAFVHIQRYQGYIKDGPGRARKRDEFDQPCCPTKAGLEICCSRWREVNAPGAGLAASLAIVLTRQAAVSHKLSSERIDV